MADLSESQKKCVRKLRTPSARAYAEIYELADLQAMRQQALEASFAITTEPVIITASSKPDGRANSGITLTSQAQIEQFLADVESVLSCLQDEEPVTKGEPTYFNFSARRIRY